MRFSTVIILGFVSSSLLACSSRPSPGADSDHAPAPSASADAGDDDGSAGDPGPDPAIAARPYVLKEPAGYDASKPAPLVIGLHGYGDGDNAQAFEQWFHLAPIASARGFLYALPSGTIDRDGYPFWNGTNACCNFYDAKVDDVAYIGKVIEDVARTHALDRDRVYVIGVSGGGFMAHRLACDLSEKLAGIVSVSGASWALGRLCAPTSPIAVLELHGDADNVVKYDGGALPENSAIYPGARATVDEWRVHNGCSGELHPTGATLDLESAIPGAETRVETYDACARGDVELWTAQGGPHAPLWTARFAPTIFDWFTSHPKLH